MPDNNTSLNNPFRPDFSSSDRMSPIDAERLTARLDGYMAQMDFTGAERMLKFRLREAEAACDAGGMLTVLNEQIGFYRKLGRTDDCLQAADAALAQAAEMDGLGSTARGTTFLNAATGFMACGMANEAVFLYREARSLYEAALPPEDARLAGLYNNMASALTETGAFQEAEELFCKAVGIMALQKHGEPDMAVTFCNLADMAAANPNCTDRESRIEEYLSTAETLLDTEDLIHDRAYAFVCGKCAAAFGMHGRGDIEKKYLARAEEIYERT